MVGGATPQLLSSGLHSRGGRGALPLWQTACRSQIVAASVARARRAQKADLRPRPPPENCSLLASELRTLWLMG